VAEIHRQYNDNRDRILRDYSYFLLYIFTNRKMFQIKDVVANEKYFVYYMQMLLCDECFMITNSMEQSPS